MSSRFVTVDPRRFSLSRQGPKDAAVSVTNTCDASVVYKFKTTAPQRYIVRNRQGVIPPGAAATVHVSLQSVEAELAAGSKALDDQFLVEFRPLAPEEDPQAKDFSALLKAGKVRKMVLDCRVALAAGAEAATPAPARASDAAMATPAGTGETPAPNAFSGAARPSAAAARVPPNPAAAQAAARKPAPLGGAPAKSSAKGGFGVALAALIAAVGVAAYFAVGQAAPPPAESATPEAAKAVP